MLRFPIRQMISSTAKKAEITTTYREMTLTRHVVRAANGWQGHHPDTDGVRRMKLASEVLANIERDIKAYEKALLNPPESIPDSYIKQLVLLREALPHARFVA